ncbi:PadR family transcriptional regulator [Gordonia shandongensis]|uniref:PadR family transcriptional regulator n=1 Tax=Gordonia shandongensis TaxID=376351 RepID=UPI0004095CDB|nr:PadR family transcriptional regulator [Gordonia shandongensis]
MSVATTRLLLLGAVGLFEPVNGYQIRRELVSWRVDEWASIRPGSIYHGLRRLTEQGLLARSVVDDGSRPAAVYELTAAGRDELEAGIVAAVTAVNVFDRHEFQAGFGLLPMLGEQRSVAALTDRREALRTAIGEMLPPGTDDRVPAHSVRSLQLWRQFAELELWWLDGVLADVAAGELSFDSGADRPPHPYAQI